MAVPKRDGFAITAKVDFLLFTFLSAKLNGLLRKNNKGRALSKERIFAFAFKERYMFIRKCFLTVSAIALSTTVASAAVTLGFTLGTNPYSGPTPTYDFESAAPFTGGLITTGSVATIRAQPFGSTGNYATVGPSDGTPGLLNLSTFATISAVSFIWGSVDAYNTLRVLDRSGIAFASFTGADVSALANGDQTNPATNPLVTISFTGLDAANVGSLEFSSSSNAFEFDNVAVVSSAVPEPATWAMMLFGFGVVGSALRRRSRTAIAVA